MEANSTLTVVIPVYNEEANISRLIYDWTQIFRDSGIFYRIVLIDDGSTDQSRLLLQGIAEKDPNIAVFSQPNAGHGIAILKGYRIAVDADWVFQIDSDHQLDPNAFKQLWDSRDLYDLLLGEREFKNASFARRCVSRTSTSLVHLLYGKEIADVNSPYRLMRSGELRKALEKMSPYSFAPNVLLTGWFVLKKKRIFKTTVPTLRAGHTRPSKMNFYFLSGSLQSAWQTVLFRMRL